MKLRLPAEWERHEATWLAWPHEKSDWPGKFAPIPWIYAQIVRHLARVEKVRILVADADVERKVRRMLKLADVALEGGGVFPSPDQSQLDSRLLSALRQSKSRGPDFTLAF